MYLANSSGSHVALTILGYQYPHAKPGRKIARFFRFDDADWLLLRLDAAMEGQEWTVTRPCLTVQEGDFLVRWLEEVDAGRQPKHLHFDFLEPALMFELADTGILRVYVQDNLRPPWQPGRGHSEDLWIDFPLYEIDLAAASASLRSQLAQYPVRTAEG